MAWPKATKGKPDIVNFAMKCEHRRVMVWPEATKKAAPYMVGVVIKRRNATCMVWPEATQRTALHQLCNAM